MPSRAAMLALSALFLRAIPFAIAHPALGGNLPSAGEFENSNGYAELGNTNLGVFWEQSQPEDVGSQKGLEENSGDGPEHSCGSGGKVGGGGGNWNGAVTTKTITDCSATPTATITITTDGNGSGTATFTITTTDTTTTTDTITITTANQRPTKTVTDTLTETISACVATTTDVTTITEDGPTVTATTTTTSVGPTVTSTVTTGASTVTEPGSTVTETETQTETVTDHETDTITYHQVITQTTTATKTETLEVTTTVTSDDCSDTGTGGGDLDYGTCSDPTILYEYGLDGRTDYSYTTQNQNDFPFGSSPDISTPQDLICNRLRSPCNAPQATIDQCYAAREATSGMTGQEAADTWNSLMT
ncbi:hypothetical protein N7504_009896 [Penicillium tannophilum]|nr:hypothetical protein N7504_009896 [Penicillium tannophilum]